MDGDADRCGFGDEHGEFVDQLRVYGLLAYYLLAVRGERGDDRQDAQHHLDAGQAGQALRRAGGQHRRRLQVCRAGDDRTRCPDRRRGERRLCLPRPCAGARRHRLANLFLLDFMVRTGKKPTELLQMLFDVVGEHFYDRIDIRLTDMAQRATAKANLDKLDASQISLGGHKVTELVTIDGYKFVMDDGGWLLIRFSGTEPLLRVYTETTDQAAVAGILADGRRLTGV
jgi:phosphomannomutase